MAGENDVVNSLCEYLAVKGYFFWRQNNTPVFDVRRKRYRKMPEWSMKGVPDIIVVYKGKFIGVEAKQKGKYQSQDQKEFEEGLVNRGGGEYIVARSIDDLVEYGF